MTNFDPSILSLVAIVIATAALLINYLRFRAQRDPEIVVYTAHDERRPSIIILVIENVGRGVAENISFSSSLPIPKEAFGLQPAESEPSPNSMVSGPLVTGIPQLRPRSKRVITWGQFGGLYSALGDRTLDITATCFSKPAFAFWRRKHKTVSRIDIMSFQATDASDHNWDQKTAKQLETIAKLLQDVTSGAKSIQVTVKEGNSDET